MICQNGHTFPFIGEQTADCLYCASLARVSAEDYLSIPELGVVPGLRAPQLELSEAVSKNLREGGVLLAEAPTGVGKSFATLLPSIVHSAQSKEQVLVVTAKKSLCNQYEHEDIPFLKEKIADAYRPQTIVAYGRNSYACRKLVNASPMMPAKKKRYLKLLDESEWGRWDEGDGDLKDPDLTAEDCQSSKCIYVQQCGYIRMRTLMAEADVVVCNPWLWGFDLQQRMRSVENKGFLGPYTHVIVDEAHKVHDGLRAAFTYRVGEKQMQTTINKISNEIGVTVHREVQLVDVWKDMFGKLKQNRGKDQKLTEDKLPTEEISRTMDLLIAEISDLTATAQRTKEVPYYIAANKLDKMLGTLKALYSQGVANNDRVVFVSYEYYQYWLTISPIDIGFVTQTAKNIKSYTYLSATLAVNGTTDFFARSMGHDPADCTELLLPTVFDLKKQALLYTSRTVPQPTRAKDKVDDYRRKLAEEIATLVTASNGNALVLFTARDHMSEVAPILRSMIPHKVITQSQNRPPAAALREYMATDNSVLFGLKSFFEGVNIPGPKLSMVILTCLPFPGRTDPVVQAQRDKAGDKWFPMVDLPSCELDVRQAAGRLIRTTTDRGVVAILDPRAVTKRYGKRLRNSLGIPNITVNLSATVKTLKSLPKE